MRLGREGSQSDAPVSVPPCDDYPVSEEQARKTTFPRGWKLWVPAVGFVVAGGVMLAVVPGMLLDNWVPSATVEERSKLLGSAAQIVLFGLGGVIAIIGVALSLARHGQSLDDAVELRARETVRREEFVDQITLDREREDARRSEAEVQRRTELERDLRARFQAAVDLLSAESTTKRTAALYALSALGDDWLAFGNPKELQVCIDVMCGYLRSAVADDARTPDEGSVRTTGYDLIREHLQRGEDGAGPPWAGCGFPLAYAPIWFSADLSGIVLTAGSSIDLSMCRLSGTGRLSFRRASVERRARIEMRAARIEGMSSVVLQDARISEGGFVSLRQARVDDGGVIAGQRVRVSAHGSLLLTRLRVNSLVDLSDASVTSMGKLTAADAHLGDHGQLLLTRAHVSEQGRLLLRRIRMEPNTVLSIDDVTAEGAEFEQVTYSVTQTFSVPLDGEGIVYVDDGPTSE